MSDRSGRVPRSGPAYAENSSPAHSTWLTIALGLLLLCIVAGVEFLPSEAARLLVTGTAVGLTAVGVVSLFAFALGIARFREGSKGDVHTRALVESDADGVLVTDQNGRVVYANRAYADLTGALKPHDVRPIERAFARAGDADGEIYRLTRQAAEGEHGTCEVEVDEGAALASAASGSRTYRIEARPLRLSEEAGSARDGLIAWRVVDVTAESARHRKEFEALRFAVEVVDAVPVGFLSVNGDDRVEFMNAHLAAELGLDLADVADGRIAFEELVSAGPRSRTTLANGAEVEDVELRRSDGKRLPARLHAGSVNGNDPDGTRHMLVMTRDTDDAALAPRNAAKLFAASPMAIASVGAHGAILQSNAAFARTFIADNLVPSTLAEIAGEAEREALMDAFESAKAGESPRPLEIVTVGQEIIRVHLVSPAAVGDEDETVLLYALEVTEQRALEREMADAQKNQAIGVIAGGVAHDFNNVLTAIVGFSDLLLAKYRPSDRSFHDVTQIRNTAFKGASLVRQLLAYTRRQTLRPKTLSMPDVLTDLSMILRRLAGDTIRVEVKHGRDLWPVRADVGALERVFVNLCVNARDAIVDRVEADLEADRKPAEGLIRIRTANVGADEVRGIIGDGDALLADQLMIEVSDTGTGMSKEVMAKIFDPFFTTKKAGKGTGLGLSSVVGIVKQSGGSIHLSSQVGEGTTFRILLPRHIPTKEEQEAPVEVRKETVRDLAGSATILFVEDEDSVRAFGTRTLKERGYTVHEAENGEDALEIIEELEGKLDLVVSDVVMPEMDGPTLFRHVREFAPDLPFIFASGYAEEAFEKSLPDATEAKFGFIPKPDTLKDLAILVKDTLDSEKAA